MRFDLNAAPQRLFEHRSQVLGRLREKTGGIRFIRIGREQSGPARAERPIENHFDRALGETVIE